MILTIISTIVSFALMLGGILMKKTADKPINETIGFRTHKAMQNEENWHYANSRCGILWLIVGAAGFAAAMLLSFVLLPKMNGKNDVLVQILPLAAQITAAVAAAVHVDRKLSDTNR